MAATALVQTYTAFAQDLHKHEIHNRMNAQRSSCVGTDPVNRFFFCASIARKSRHLENVSKHSREDHVHDTSPVPFFLIEDRCFKGVTAITPCAFRRSVCFPLFSVNAHGHAL